MKFSIIIPVYNVAPYLRECLDSVLAQICPDWECICVDDGSTDGSGEILDEYAARVNKNTNDGKCRFKILHQKNAGVSAARNAALMVVEGAWVFFLDADDCIAKDLLESCDKYLMDANSDMVMFGLEFFAESHSTSRMMMSAAKPMPIDRLIQYEVAEADFVQFAYPAKLLAGLRFPGYVMGEDRLFQAWALVRAGKMVQLDGIGYYYRQREGSAVNSKNSWRKVQDDISHSIRRMVALLFCHKRIEWRVYRHQIGLWLNILRGLA